MNAKSIKLALLLVLALAGSLHAQAKITLKIASVAPSRSPWDIEQRALAQEWSEITKGQVSVLFYDSGSLGGEKAVIQKFRSDLPNSHPPRISIRFQFPFSYATKKNSTLFFQPTAAI